jgi:hypothetical protein
VKRRSAVVRQLRDNLADLIRFAEWDQSGGDELSEMYRRGNIAGQAYALSLLLEEGSPEYREFRALAEAQRERILSLVAKKY